jgi:uncharacterized membrane protein
MSTTMIAVFASRQQVIDAVNSLGALELVDVSRAAVVAKADTGKMIIVDNLITPQEGRNAGMGFGALMTALGIAHIGALALPGIGPLIAIGASALVGGLVGGATGQFAAVLINFGFQKDQVQALADHLENGEAALILELDERDHLAQIHAELEKLEVQQILETERKVPSVADFKRLPLHRDKEKV